MAPAHELRQPAPARRLTAWLRCYDVRPQARIRLICFPHAGGMASFYKAWPGDFGERIEVQSLQYPGHEDRLGEQPICQMSQLADLASEAVAQVMDRPVALFGHSLGAVVAYEVARRLARIEPSQLACLFVSGRQAPGFHRHQAKHLADDKTLWAELRRLGGTDSFILDHPGWRSILLPILRSDYRLDETYAHHPVPRLSCPVVAFIGDRDPEADISEVIGWSDVTSARFELRAFSGDHFYLIPHRRAVTSTVADHLGLSGPARRESPGW